MPGTRYILLWTFPREPDYVATAQAGSDPVRFVPLRYRVLHDLRDMVDSARILLPSRVVPPDARGNLYRSAVNRLNAFYDALQQRPSMPWLGGVQQYMVLQGLYGFTYWHSFLTSLPDAGSVQLYPPFARSFLNGRQLIDVDMLNQVYAAPAPLPWRQRARNAVDTLVGACLHRFPRVFSRPLAADAAAEPAPLVVCGLQATDWIAQAGLVHELLQSGERRFRWMIPERDRMSKTPDELLGLQQMDACESRALRISLDGYGYLQTRKWRFDSLSRAAQIHLSRSLEPAVAAALPEPAFRPWHGALAYLIAAQNPDARLKYDSIDRLFRSLNPQVVVMSSGIDQLTYVRSWARRNRVKTVRLPHGVEAHLDARYAWDASVIGTLGDRVTARLRETGRREDRVMPVGGMHLAHQGQAAAERVAKLRTDRPAALGRVLIMLSGYWGYDYPDAMDEVRDDFERLARAFAPRGARLALRCHPRHFDASTYKLLCAELGDLGLDIEWSDAKASLAEDLARSEAALTRTWNGSALMCLYADVPLLAWLPRPTYRDLEEPLRGLPLCAASPEEAAGWLVRLRADGPFRMDVVEKQRGHLGSFLANPWDPPYAPAVQLIKEEMEKLSSAK